MAGAVAAIGMCKDEVDIAEPILRHLAEQVDFIVVADNGSTDGTRDLLADLTRDIPLTVFDDYEVAYYQSRKMSRLAALVADQGADWVVPTDFDEWWYSPFGRIADVLESLPPDTAIAEAALYDHVATGADVDDLNPIVRMAWRRVHPTPLPKVAARLSLPVTIEQGNHDATHPCARVPGQLIVRHFPYRSAEQFVRKARNGHAAYTATDLPMQTGQHWRGYGQIAFDQGDEACADIFRTWFWSADPAADDTLIHDPVGGI